MYMFVIKNALTSNIVCGLLFYLTFVSSHLCILISLNLTENFEPLPIKSLEKGCLEVKKKKIPPEASHQTSSIMFIFLTKASIKTTFFFFSQLSGKTLIDDKESNFEC